MPQCTRMSPVASVLHDLFPSIVFHYFLAGVCWSGILLKPKGMPQRAYLRVEPLPCRSIRNEAREEFSEGRDPMHLSSLVTGVSL
ncbi:hypothetical protein CDL15_Pgr016297 [Punica granatum]|uniref:Uncharacterized protein n=1 Tax=Punica granatum TaxID=22663 RepID=A0A218W5G2_PUNGR|nr:hypothetical protein CDL15_Pgr016297 [Punica granatum]